MPLLAPGLLLIALLGLGPAEAHGQALGVPLDEVLDVLVLDRDVIAIDGQTGGGRTVRLRLQEKVLWTEVRGRVAMVLTDQRVLAVGSGSGSWQEEGYHRGETFPNPAVLGDRLALLVSSRRALGFDGGSNNLVESSLGLREAVLAIRAGANVGVVVTDRRALGLSPVVGGFFTTPITSGERIDEVSAVANLATVTSNRTVRVFRSATGSWELRRRPLQ